MGPGRVVRDRGEGDGFRERGERLRREGLYCVRLMRRDQGAETRERTAMCTTDAQWAGLRTNTHTHTHTHTLHHTHNIIIFLVISLV